MKSTSTIFCNKEPTTIKLEFAVFVGTVKIVILPRLRILYFLNILNVNLRIQFYRKHFEVLFSSKLLLMYKNRFFHFFKFPCKIVGSHTIRGASVNATLNVQCMFSFQNVVQFKTRNGLTTNFSCTPSLVPFEFGSNFDRETALVDVFPELAFSLRLTLLQVILNAP